MNILLTGSTGYIGRRLLPVLLEAGHSIVCLVRDKRRFSFEGIPSARHNQLTIIEHDLETSSVKSSIPDDIDVAYYLVHSMTSSKGEFKDLEKTCAENFITLLQPFHVKQIVYVGGISNDTDLSEHLTSRKNVEEILKKGPVPVTILRAAIIIGSGSASFEIIRDLVEKLPVMLGPKWLRSKCQPIAIRNVLNYLEGVLLNPVTFNQTYDIGGPDVLTYHEMLDGYSRARKLKRLIIQVPVLSPRLSSLWLYFVTSTSYVLARNLVDSLKNNVICHNTKIHEHIPLDLLTYDEALQLAFDKISQNNIISSWKDSIPNVKFHKDFLSYVQVPEHGCFRDTRIVELKRPMETVMQTIYAIGGERGWYFGNRLWRIRGFLDKLFGGVGLRRGRRHPNDLKPGDALDFWRVLLVDKPGKRLLLYAEMKLPGEAWLEFQLKEKNGTWSLHQTATFRPLGLWGRLYWYAVLPFHFIIFPRMAGNIARY